MYIGNISLRRDGLIANTPIISALSTNKKPHINIQNIFLLFNICVNV